MKTNKTILMVSILALLAGCQRDSLDISREDYQREVTVVLKHMATQLGKSSGSGGRGISAVLTSVDAETCKARLAKIRDERRKLELFARCAFAIANQNNASARVLYQDAGREGQRYWKEVSTP